MDKRWIFSRGILSTQLSHGCTLKLLLTKKEHLNEEEEKSQ
jgi:hypothetical protein